MIETTIKKRTVIQRKLVRVDASPERQLKFDTIERDFLTGLPIVGLAITFVAVLAVNVIFFGQPTTSGYREKRERAALDSSSALLAQMYETANDTARAKVAQLYDEVKADGVITGEELQQVQDALIVAGRGTRVEGRTVGAEPGAAPASQDDLVQVIQWLSTGNEALRERAREALSDQVLDQEEFAAIKALKEGP